MRNRCQIGISGDGTTSYPADRGRRCLGVFMYHSVKERQRPASSNSRAAKHNKERHCEERKRYVLRAKSDFNSDCFIRQPQGCCHLQSPLSVGRALDWFV